MRSETILRVVCCMATLAAGAGAVSTSRAADPATAVQPPTQVDIRPQPVSSALTTLALQTHQEILFTPEIATGKTTQGVKGTLTADAALSRLLVGTGLSSSKSPSGMLLVSQADAKGAPPSSGPPSASVGAPNDQSPNKTTPTQENTGRLEEVVVTARKQKESLQDVPVVVAVISKVDLQNNLATDLQTIGELAPQVMIGRAITGTGAVIGIRGISSASSDSGVDQSVVVDIDNVPLTRGRVVETTQFDLQQVEVLEGPQALFFGKNSPAGVISIETADPSDHFEASGKAGYEFKADEEYGEAVVSGPIISGLEARLALRWDDMDGWIKNVAQPIPNPFQPFAPLPGAEENTVGPEGHDVTGRLTLLWAPTDDFNAKLKLTVDNQTLNSNAAYSEPFCVAPTTVPTELGAPMPYADCAINMRKAESNLPAVLAVNYPYGNGGIPYLNSKFTLAGLTLNKTFADFALTSTTGYYGQLHQASHAADYSPLTQVYDSEREDYELFNEELRLNTNFPGPVNAMAGGYFEHSTRDWLNAPDILNIFNSAAQNYTSTVTTSNDDSDSYSAFGQVRWKILPSVEFDAGARYTYDFKTSTLVSLVNNPISAPLFALYPADQPINPRYSDHNVSPEATLTWHPEVDQTVYSAYKQGFKAGGISNPGLLQSTATAQNLLFGPEHSNGFEVGYKADLFEHTLRLDLAAYRYNYNGLQVTALDQVTFTYTLRNAARARTQGITGSFEWRATDRLTFDGNVGFNHARYLDFPNAQCYAGQTAAQGCVDGGQNLSGLPLNRAPNVTAKLGADYKADLVQGWKADLSFSGAYSSSYQSATDYDPGGPQSAFWLLNAAVNVSPENDRYKFSLIGRNLTNSYYKLVTFQWTLGGPGQWASVFNRPLEVVLEASCKF
jgi:iron complex outermembrane recepter protein